MSLLRDYECPSCKTPRAYSEKTDIQWQASATQTTPVAIQIEGLLVINTAS